MSAPRRIQRRRTCGWRLPENAVIVDRTSRFGNPFRVIRAGGIWTMALPDGRACGAYTSPVDAARATTEEFRSWLHAPEQAELLGAGRRELPGKDLACWCREDAPCHGDIWLAAVNPSAGRAAGGA